MHQICTLSLYNAETINRNESCTILLINQLSYRFNYEY